MDQEGQARVRSGCFVQGDGTRIWLSEGLYHRTDGPAVVHRDGATEWWCRGWLHREDGPAVLDARGHGQWWNHGRPTWPGGGPLEDDPSPTDDYSCLAPERWIDTRSHPATHDDDLVTVDLRDWRRSRLRRHRALDA